MRTHLLKLVLVVAFVLPWVTHAQNSVLTVANGTATSNKVPIYGTWMDVTQKSQMLYPDSMLTTMRNKSVTQLKFYTEATSSTCSWSSTMTVSMGIVTDSNLSAGFSNAQLTTVYIGTLSVSGNEMVITLDDPLLYPSTGGNLLVQFYQASGIDYTGCGFLGRASTTLSRYAYNGNSDVTSTILPKLTFTYIDAITCPRPSNFIASNLHTTSAQLDWVEVGTATSWTLEYADSNFTPGTGVGTVITASDTTEQLMNLTLGTTYYAYVRSDCSADDVSAYRFISFTTPTAEPVNSFPYVCNFSNNSSLGWAFVNGSETNFWVIDSAAGTGAGDSVLYITDDGISNTYSMSDVSVAWAYRDFNFNPGQYSIQYNWRCLGESSYDYLRVALVPSSFAMTAGVNPGWSSDVVSLSGATATLDGGNKLNLSGSWQIHSQVFTVSTAGTYRLVYFWRNDGGGGSNPPAGIDNIAVDTLTCPQPTALTLDTATTTELTVSWTDGGSESSWMLGINGTEQEVSNNPYTFSNLVPNTAYSITVRAICGVDDTSIITQATYRTVCDTIQSVPFFEGFEDYNDQEVPFCWSVSQSYGVSPSVIADSYYAHSGTKALKFYVDAYSSMLSENTIVLPSMANVSGLQLSFWAYSEYSAPDVFSVGVMDTAGVFVPYDTITLTSTYAPYVVYLNNYTGSGNKIAFHAQSSNQHYGYVYVDDISVTEIPDCLVPQYPTFQSATTGTLTFGWNEMGTATSWLVAYDTVPITDFSLYTPVQAYSNPYTITGLDSSTTYYIYVQADCGGTYSGWSDVLMASTNRCDDNCNIIAHLTAEYGYEWDYSSVNFVQGGNVICTLGQTSNLPSTQNVVVCSGEPVHLIWDNLYSSFDYSDACALNITDAYDFDMYTLQTGNTHNTGDTIYTFTSNCIVPTCVRPKNITFTGINSNSAMVHWVDTMATSWTVQYGPVGFTYGTGTSLSATADSILLTGLTGGTNYDVYVAAQCSDTTLVSNVAQFATSCVTISSFPYTENFESYANNAIPTCWTVYQNYLVNPCVYVNSTCAHNSNASLSVYMYTWSTLVNNTIALPHVDNLQALEISFYAYQEDSNPADVFSVGIMDTTGIYVPLDTIALTPTYNRYTVYFNNYTGSGDQIAFYAEKADGSVHIYIDDVVIDSIPSCPEPNHLAISSIGTSSITLSWNEPGTAINWQVSYDTSATFNPLNGTIVNVSTNPTTINNLQGGVNYSFYVRSVCGGGDSSIWVGPIVGIPNSWSMVANQSDTIYMCGGRVFDDGGANGYYSDNQFSVLTIYPDTTSGTPYVVNLSGVVTMEGFTYDNFFIYDGADTNANQLLALQGQSYSSGININVTASVGPLTLKFMTDGSGNYSGFDLAVNCIQNTCPIPLNVHATLATTTSLVVDWTDQTTPASWMVEYGPTGFAQGTTAGTMLPVTSHPVTIPNLTPLTAYDFYVRPICAGNDTGSWTPLPTTIRTALCDGVTMAVAGTGTSTSTMGPAYTYYNYSLSETIIDSTELSTLGGDITAFEFQALTADAGSYMDSCVIYLANTTKSAFIDNVDFVNVDSTFTLVYSGNLNYTIGWNTFAFDTTFAWDGHSNVIMIIDRNDGTYESGDDFAATEFPMNKSINAYNDNFDFDPTNIVPPAYSSEVTTIRPNYHFISCGSSCPTPIVSSENHTYDQATIVWTGGGNNYEVALKAVNQPVWPAETVVVGHTYTFPGLTPVTTYNYRIRQNCDTNGYSDWQTGTFTTDSLPCFAPMDLSVVGMGTSAEFDWTPGLNETTWQLNVYNSTFNQTYTTTTHPYTVPNLISGVTYNAKVRSLCGNGLDSSDWSNSITFTTEACDPVTNVIAGSTKTGSIVLTWTPGANNTGNWEVEYGYAGFGQTEGTKINTTTPSATLTGLTPGMAYDAYVRAVCGEGYVSIWSTRVTFTVTGIEDVIDAAQINLYPNPTTGATTISLVGVQGNVTLTLVDMSGRTVMTESLECSGDCKKTLNIDKLSQGAYFVRVNGSDINIVKKLIVK